MHLVNHCTATRCVGGALKLPRTISTHTFRRLRGSGFTVFSRCSEVEWASYQCLTDRWTLVSWCGLDAVYRPSPHTLQVGCKWKTDFYQIREALSIHPLAITIKPLTQTMLWLVNKRREPLMSLHPKSKSSDWIWNPLNCQIVLLNPLEITSIDGLI